MNDMPEKSKPSTPSPSLSEQVGTKAARKLKARRSGADNVWFGLGMMGLVGWSVAVPTLLGAALGLWIDRRFPGSHSYTLALLMVGLSLGCFNAWRWIAKEDNAMREQQEDDADE